MVDSRQGNAGLLCRLVHRILKTAAGANGFNDLFQMLQPAAANGILDQFGLPLVLKP